MEHLGQGVEFGMASFQKCHPTLSCQMAESAPIAAQKANVRGKGKSRHSKRCHLEEMPVIPEQAMEFLSRTWSASSSDLFQILSNSGLGSSPAEPEQDEERGDEGEDKGKNLAAVRFHGRTYQLFNQTCVSQPLGTPNCGQRRHKLLQPSWLKVGNMKAMLRSFLLESLPAVTGIQRRRRRDELRLHSAQAHAAVSVAQLAAAIAGIVSTCDLRPAAASASAGDMRLGTVLASAAALVATVCAETAETNGANSGRVTSAVRAGLESRSSADLVSLTATAATCLRGAAVLKERAADLRGISTSNAMALSVSAGMQKGTTLRVCLPCGSVRVRMVSIFTQSGDGAVVLRLGKKRLQGVFATYKDYVVSVVQDGGGEVVVEGRPTFPVALVMSEDGVTVKLLFEHQTQCKLWMAAIEGMLAEQKLKCNNLCGPDDQSGWAHAHVQACTHLCT